MDNRIPLVSPGRPRPLPPLHIPLLVRIWLALCFLVTFITVIAHAVALHNGTPVHITDAVYYLLTIFFWFGVVLLPWLILGWILRGAR
jgi:hypothetical protein